MSNRNILAICILLTLGCSAVACAADIWGTPIMRQPFDKQPLREIKIPEWVQKLTTVTYCFSAVSDELRKTQAKNGAEISELFFADPFYAYYDSKFLKKRNPNVPADKLEKDMATYKKLGIKVLGVIPPPLQGEAYFANPEWRRIEKNTNEIPCVDQVKEPYGGQLCELGPWGDEFINILAEIMTKYPAVEAFSFDGLHDYGVCYCKSCRDRYRADTGKEIPDMNMDNQEFRHYQYWLDRQMESFVERIQNRIKGINPNCALITWTTNAGRYGHLLSIPRNMSARMNLLFDAPDQEFWMDETNRGNTVVPAFANAYMWSVSNHRVAFSSTYMMSHGNPYGGESFPTQELIRRAMMVLTFGPRSSTGVGGNKPVSKALEQMLREVKKREAWTNEKEPERWAAMVMSDNTKTFYGRDPQKVEDRYLANVFGVFRTALEEHLPITVINDWNLNITDLDKYKVLVLPNTACMTNEQAAAIRRFVKNGGGLVATVDSSLYDEYGDQRSDFLLADLFGVHYKGVAVGSAFLDMDVNFAKGITGSYWDKSRSIFNFTGSKHPIFDNETFKSLVGERAVCFKGQAAEVTATPDATVVGTMITRELGATPMPSVVVRNYGKGKVVYMASGMDSAYYLYPYPYYRNVIAQAMRWAAPEQPKITVDAPMCINSMYYRQKTKGERLVVQLFNDFKSTSNHAKPDDDVPLPEEIVSIRDIKVTFKDYNISRIRLEPEGKTLKITRVPGGVQVTVPELSVHSMVVAELKQN